jgi:hypothetical protein
MKKQLIIATLAALALIVTACGKKLGAANNDDTTPKTSINQEWNVKEVGTVIDNKDIHPEILKFVETHFPKTSISNCQKTEHLYKVRLDDKTSIEFSQKFEWTKVKCENSTIYKTVPESIVPKEIAAYVVENYPHKSIVEVEEMTFGWEIELDDSQEIRLDSRFNVIPAGKSYLNCREIQTFVATHFPKAKIRSAQQFDDEIEVKLTDNTEIDFYLNLDWKNIDCEDALIYQIVPAELVPEHITSFVKKNYVHNHIEEIERVPQGGWEIVLDNKMEFKFDSKYNLTGIDDKNL